MIGGTSSSVLYVNRSAVFEKSCPKFCFTHCRMSSSTSVPLGATGGWYGPTVNGSTLSLPTGRNWRVMLVGNADGL